MSIWKRQPSLEEVNLMPIPILKHLDLRIVELGPDYLIGQMPVDARHHQPNGRLHGGVSCVVAETMGSLGAWLCTDDDFAAFGVDINATHLNSVAAGIVSARAHPLKLGKRMQCWQTDIRDEQGLLICSARLTVAIRAL